MKLLLRTLPLLLLALPAYAGPAELFAEWQRLHDPDQQVGFAESYGFLHAHPGWPQETMLRIRVEQAALAEHPDRATMEKFCIEQPPVSGRGMIACAQAGIGDEAQRTAWVKQAWLQGDFSGSEEELLRQHYHFSHAEDEARVDRLLFEDRVVEARRLLPVLTPPQRMLAEARIALITEARNAQAKTYQVPKELKNSPGLMFNRIQWRAKHDLDDGVVELLLAAPENPPYADLWWPYRAATVRAALEERRYPDAMRILERHGQLNAENGADALFLKGWITMEFRGDARAAYKDFFALYGLVATPVSKARAAYWAGRAAKKNGNPEIAQGWFEKAAQHPTTYYGQLAISELTPGDALTLPDTPDAGEMVDTALAETAFWLLDQGNREMGDLFLSCLAEHSDGAQAEALVQALHRRHDVHGMVKVAKQALRRHVTLVDAGWPLVEVPPQAGVEPALALAIARQESEFDVRARSRADARGLMQLLPATANHLARHDGLPYSAADLYDPEANMVLGGRYLDGLVRGWDGSYVLAIASYNAGPANVRKWVAQYGAPPKNLDGAIDWVEKIPFMETRNYVERVLENLQVYRARLKPETPLGLTGDLMR